jgi:ferredoxin
VKVPADKSLRVGHGRCYDVAAGLSGDDEDGCAAVRGDGSVLRGRAEAARLAIRLCPERTVTLAG